MESRRDFLKLAGTAASAALIQSRTIASLAETGVGAEQSGAAAADYVLRINATPVQIGSKQIVSTITYNGQFPGPLVAVQRRASR